MRWSSRRQFYARPIRHKSSDRPVRMRDYSAASYRQTAEYNDHVTKQTFAPGHGGVVGRVRWKANSFKFPMFLLIRNTHTVKPQDLATIAQSLVPLLREGGPMAARPAR